MPPKVLSESLSLAGLGNPRRFVRPALVGLVALGSALSGGCRSGVVHEANDNRVHHGEVLMGRLPPGARVQEFTFEGVESSLVDLTVQADASDVAAPRLRLFDPDGREVALPRPEGSNVGKATVTIPNVVLTRTGVHKVVVEPLDTTTATGPYYRFWHTVRVPPPLPRQLWLAAGQAQPVFFSTPRDGVVTVAVRPLRPGIVPAAVGLTDPSGGQGPSIPRFVAQGNGLWMLRFRAAVAGTYRLLASAQPGQQGPGIVTVNVAPPPAFAGNVFHPDAPAFEPVSVVR